jgi:subtilisin family serine protease
VRRPWRAWRSLAGPPLLLAAILVPSAAAQDEGTTSDPGRSRQWALDRIGADEAWRVATGEGTTIAIVDSGIDVGHPDLRDKIAGTTDCVGQDDAPGGCLDGAGADDAGHGTHVAGISAAATDNREGIAGVAPAARLLAVRVLANSCPPDADPGSGACEAEGTESDVAEGIRWAADHGADVINLSLGSVTQAVVGPGRVFADALAYAWDRGAIPVLVAGNDLLLPGSVVDVPAVVVSATARDDSRASYSSGVGNVRWAVAAPGGESDDASSCEAATPNGILSTFFRPAPDGSGTSGYACVAGTSMAAPHVTGALAVLRSAGLAPEDAVERLLATATDLGPAGPDSTFGAGRIDLAAAVAGLAPTGQPIGPAGSTVPAGTDATTATTAAPTTTGGPSEASTTAPTPTTVAPGPGETTPPVQTDDEQLAANGAPAVGPPEDEALPTGIATLAVLAVALVSAGHAWRYLATHDVGRRTPRR